MNTIFLCAKTLACAVLVLSMLLPAGNMDAQVANVALGIPTAYGGDLGLVAGGVAFQSRTRNTEKGFKPDANLGLSVGLGNSRDLVGVMATANIFGLSNQVGEDQNFGSGTLDLQFNRRINDYISVGAGVRNLTNWLPPETVRPPRNNRSFFAVGNFIIPTSRNYTQPFSLLFVTAGVGNGIFRLDRDFDPNTSGTFNVFGSAAVQVLRGTNVIMEWNGYDLTSGVSVYPFKKLPGLGGVFAFTDLTESRPRFNASVGYFVNLNQPKPQRRAVP